MWERIRFAQPGTHGSHSCEPDFLIGLLPDSGKRASHFSHTSHDMTRQETPASISLIEQAATLRMHAHLRILLVLHIHYYKLVYCDIYFTSSPFHIHLTDPDCCKAWVVSKGTNKTISRQPDVQK